MASIPVPNNALLNAGSNVLPNNAPLGSNVLISAREVATLDVFDPLSGKTYAVTVEKIDSSGHATNITGRRDWLQTAQEVIEVLNSKTDGRVFTSGKVTLQGEFSGIEQQEINIDDRQVSIVTAEVKYKQQDDAPSLTVKTFSKQQDTLSDQQQTTVFRTLRNLSDSLVVSHTKQEPINNAPGRPNVNPSNNAVPNNNNQNNTSQPKQETVIVFEDERMEVCKGRKKSIVCDEKNQVYPSLDYALAHQLKNMGSLGNSNLNAKTEKQIAKSLRKNVGNFIKEQSTHWTQDQYFTDIVDSLKDARVHNVTCYQRTIDKHNEQHSTGWAKLLLNSTSLKPAEKEEIVGLYADYILNGGKCIGNTFLSAFVEYYRKQAGIHFQVVMIEANGPIIKKAISYPNGENIDSTRCAFIYRNNYEYLSYNRKASPAGLTELAQRDLNHPTKNPINSKPKEISKNKNVGGKIFTIEMPSDGQCLDRSIAYHLASTNHSFASLAPDQQKNKIKEVADSLRHKVKDKIRSYNNNDEKFYQVLQLSIASIPAFANDVSDESKESSRARLEGIFKKLSDEGEDSIHLFEEVINEDTIKNLIINKKLTDFQKNTLKYFYAEYIIQEDTNKNNNMNNYLDSAFLYMLPKIRSKDFKNGINCAVVQDGKIIGVFGQQDAIIDDNWFFINFINKNHYDAVDMQASKTTVNSMIDAHYKTILNDFIAVVHRGVNVDNGEARNSPNTVETALLDLKKSHPTAYYAFCELIWWREHNKWEHKEIFNEPACRITVGGELEKIDQYKNRIKVHGDALLTMPKNLPRTITTDELAEFLRSFKPEDLHKLVADNGIIF
jgi:hypothetical protein